MLVEYRILLFPLVFYVIIHFLIISASGDPGDNGNNKGRNPNWRHAFITCVTIFNPYQCLTPSEGYELNNDEISEIDTWVKETVKERTKKVVEHVI